MTDQIDDLYQEEILHHYKNPLNYGEIPDADIVIEEKNVSCGDAAIFYIKLSSDKKTVSNISFTSVGCAISTASSSILTEYLKGKSVKKAALPQSVHVCPHINLIILPIQRHLRPMKFARLSVWPALTCVT